MSALWHCHDLRLGARLHIPELTISDGFTAIIGASGAGKTSLLDILVGYQRPDGGRCDAQGVLAKSTPAWVPAGGGLWAGVTVREHLRAVCPSERSADIDDLIELVELGHRVDAKPEQLSAGECQRLALARALAHPAPVLVLDEALAHIDSRRVEQLWAAVVDRLCASGRSCVYATHDPSEVIATADRVVVLEGGRLHWAGSVAEAYATPPDPATGQLLGPINWISNMESVEFQLRPGPLRPERLHLLPADDGPCEVLEHRFLGSHARSRLRGPQGGECTVVHRPAGALSVGDRLKLVVLGLMACLLVACAGEAPAPTASSWMLPAEGGRLPAPRGLGFDDQGRLLVLDNAGRVLRHTPGGEEIDHWWMPEWSVGKAEGICQLADGRIAVADTHYSRVVLFDENGMEIARFGSLGHGPGQFIYPIAITQDDAGRIYVAEYGGNDRIQVFDSDLQPIASFGKHGTGTGQFQRPGGIAWMDGTLYVADAFNNRIQAWTDDGTWLGLVAPDIAWRFPYDITIAPGGRLAVVEYAAARVSIVETDGRLVSRFGGPGRESGRFATPWGLTALPDGRLVVADTGNHRVVELQP
jgi:ABC-type nitrate/sulfonate/bicarbonate transport system ATPase subunit/DNA-binding beta-propeller fold protein YncE